MWKIIFFLVHKNIPLNMKLKAWELDRVNIVTSFWLRDEGGVGSFLGIIIVKTRKSQFHLIQNRIIQKVLTAADMAYHNSVSAPAYTTALGLDTDGFPFNEP